MHVRLRSQKPRQTLPTTINEIQENGCLLTNATNIYVCPKFTMDILQDIEICSHRPFDIVKFL